MKGKLEAQIQYDTTVMIFTDDSANNESVTLAAGDYYYISSADTEANDLLAEIESQINDSSGIGGGGDTITVTLGATGRITIATSGSSVAVNWNSEVSFRNMMGFTGNLSGAASYEAPNQCQALWLPDCHFQNLTGEYSGWWEFDDQVLESPRGDVFRLFGAKKKINSVTWPTISRARAWAEAEVLANESFESFLLNGIRAGEEWATGKIRFHPDETDDSTYFTYVPIMGNEFRPEFIRQHWTGKYTVNVPRAVRDPDE